MEKIRLNESPIRTCEKFGVNDVVLEGFTVPEVIKAFDSVTIKSGETKLQTNAIKKEASLKYGVGDLLEEQVIKQSNQSYKIVINENQENVELDFDFQENNRSLVDYVEIIAEEGCKGTVILKYKSQDYENSPYEYYHNGICRIEAKKNSNVQVILVNLLNGKSRNFFSLESYVEEDAKAEVITVDFGGKSSVTNYYMNVAQNNAAGSMNSIYLGKEEQKLDINYIAHLNGRKSKIDIEVQGALKDQATKSFKGTIDFKTGAKYAKGNENEFCMLLSDKAKSKALPMLLCTEEDVEGNHSSASGKVDPKQLFYLLSRGFSQKEAMKLIVKARFSHIIDRIEQEELKEEVLAEIDKRLD
ncbi:SufB/SufD family protein [Anaerosporobacter sp.]